MKSNKKPLLVVKCYPKIKKKTNTKHIFYTFKFLTKSCGSGGIMQFYTACIRGLQSSLGLGSPHIEKSFCHFGCRM